MDAVMPHIIGRMLHYKALSKVKSGDLFGTHLDGAKTRTLSHITLLIQRHLTLCHFLSFIFIQLYTSLHKY